MFSHSQVRLDRVPMRQRAAAELGRWAALLHEHPPPDLEFRTPMRFELPPYASCSFCDDLLGTRECAIVAGNEHAVAEIDERQYERGAMLVIPRKHRESILDIESREIESVYRLAREVAHAAAKAFGAQGMNIFQNNGRQAGQHEPHFHVHVVPRFGDSDPHRIFLQHDCQVMSIEEQRTIAGSIRAAM
jgi:histidine triad (HIT) family protein